MISLVDIPRIEARQAIAELKQLGIKEKNMITWDNPRTAERITRELGIDRFYSEVLPQDKLQIIRQLQAQGRTVMFTSDGINDSPDLAAVEIGVTVGLAATDLELETAAIGSEAVEIERLPQIISLSRKTPAVIIQNVIFSMSINVLAVILGGFGIIGPVIGAVMHELSALPVLSNSSCIINYQNPESKASCLIM